jgi:endonuclease G
VGRCRSPDDTFHFTNCSPQHSGMNQKTWLGLEDYILANARVHNLRICVFTGPVLRPDDMDYRGLKLPKEYWKVVAFRTDDRPSATAYMVSQGKLIEDLEFVFGRYKTTRWRSPRSALAGLDFASPPPTGIRAKRCTTQVDAPQRAPSWKGDPRLTAPWHERTVGGAR